MNCLTKIEKFLCEDNNLHRENNLDKFFIEWNVNLIFSRLQKNPKKTYYNFPKYSIQVSTNIDKITTFNSFLNYRMTVTVVTKGNNRPLKNTYNLRFFYNKFPRIIRKFYNYLKKNNER